ncbi:hypothetical protein PTTG_11946 [Puccinia triticina 1-1 BBBD Race 1]|uniref:Uncharacterized protein n=1 Tax=Puccinia triticina (isolate 1-1 / race 1 (BBBD)) TaxID=630390 RepID=A0A180GJ73_PUCT1|nr:hypothetical protein PTTG_11946 [Puccinia triticina 1-1 BBBD Race 1]
MMIKHFTENSIVTSPKDKMFSKYCALKEIIETVKNPYDDVEEETEQFKNIHKHFIEPSFLEDINRICSIFRIYKADEVRISLKDWRIYDTFQNALQKFCSPQVKLSGKRSKFEFMLEYQIVKFLYTHYPEILLGSPPNKTDHMDLQNRFKFMEYIIQLCDILSITVEAQDCKEPIDKILDFYDQHIEMQEWIDNFYENQIGFTIQFTRSMKEAVRMLG